MRVSAASPRARASATASRAAPVGIEMIGASCHAGDNSCTGKRRVSRLVGGLGCFGLVFHLDLDHFLVEHAKAIDPIERRDLVALGECWVVEDRVDEVIDS